MKRILFILSICLAFSANSLASGFGKNIIIEGEVVNLSDKSAKTITAIDCNPWSDISHRHATRIDSTGHFKTFVNIPFGHNFTIYYDGAFFCQYAEPGDSIHLSIDAACLNAGATYSGAHASLNNEYGKAYARLFNTFYTDELPSEPTPKEEYLKLFNDIHARNSARIAAYADSVGLCRDASDLLTRSALFSIANSALEHTDETPDKVLSFFADSIFGLDDEANLREMMFPLHLQAYLMRLESVVKPDSIGCMVDAIAARHPKSLNRDIMLAIYLKEFNEEKDYPTFPRDLFSDAAIYESLFHQPDTKEALPAYQDTEGAVYEWRDGAPVASGCSNLSELLAKEYAGKIVYLDLWATWCGPCIVANRSLPDVARYFSGSDIVFVSVAMKSDFDKWKKHAAASPANCKNYFIKSDDDAELIMSAFNMSGFPAFRIIGKDSRILDSNPPRPNSPQIYESLSNALQ